MLNSRMRQLESDNQVKVKPTEPSGKKYNYEAMSKCPMSKQILQLAVTTQYTIPITSSFNYSS